MATFTYAPSYSLAATTKPAVKALKFGDGYEQRARYGMNNTPRSFNVTFGQRTTAEADAIEAFFAATGGADSFDWTPPFGAAGKFKVMDWTRTIEAGNVETITAVFDEVFEP